MINELALNDDRTRETIPVITLWQPWCSWVAWNWKTIESRTHDLFAGLVGKRVAFHAAIKSFDRRAMLEAAPWLTAEQSLKMAKTPEERFPRGAILCTALVKDHRRLSPADAERALIECETLRFGLILEDIRPLARPLIISGQRGIWRVRRELLADAL